MALPTGWDETAEITSREKYVREYKNWSWNAGYGHTIGTAKFDFRVSTYVDGKNSVEVDNENKWAVSFTYQIVNISGPTRGFGSSVVPTQAEYIKEMMMLSYASVNPLPKRGNSIFDESFTGTGTEEDPIVYSTTEPVIDTISLSQAGTSDVWHMVFSAKKISAISWTKNTPEATEVPTSQLQIPPWELGTTVTVSVSTESQVLGMGFKVGVLSASDAGDKITAGTAAEYFADTSGGYEVIQNTAKDPFRSPPSTKIGVATYTLERSFESAYQLGTISNYVTNALVSVNSGTLQLGPTFKVGKGSAMLSGFSVTPAVFNEKADWLPNQKHPFGKKYSELGWTPPASKEPTDIAINSFGKTLEANRAVDYVRLSASISARATGWGVFIPNKGYRELKAGVQAEIFAKNKSKGEESFLDANGVVTTADNAVVVAYTTFDSTEDLSVVVALFFEPPVVTP